MDQIDRQPDTISCLVEGEPVVVEDRMELDASSTNLTGTSTPCNETHSETTSEVTIAIESQTSVSSTTTRISPTPPVMDDADKRFISTFRGRTIHGLTIDLPSGYSGLVLRGEASNPSRQSHENEQNNKATDSNNNQGHKTNTGEKVMVAEAQKPTKRPRGRLTRSAASKPTAMTIEDENEGENMPTDATQNVPDVNSELEEQKIVEAQDTLPVRHITPQAQFSSFTLWHADRPVDKGNDEYYRSITEWISLAQEQDTSLRKKRPSPEGGSHAGTPAPSEKILKGPEMSLFVSVTLINSHSDAALYSAADC
ncbi:hypothetical protein JR316_0007877 [Psilocybe cubensis]|nr:hypothetical protein JR316_0007877 [Psilocybe cubensis]KAH9479289.1 hypothetical protein JR316_0007877 [Psilocybe cubensis]